ncbi:MAG TPA: CocE/NonD family hydrolase [Terriglobales bacterium]|jgi:putative CocE/NonD family hydrolase|nr:CocE/NonD family hydrolase [Terriglobales bacterium]
MKRLLGLLSLLSGLLLAQANPLTAPAPPAEFHGVEAHSLYLPMHDGVRLALQVLLPPSLPTDRRLPALLEICRFGRVPQDGKLTGENQFWVEHGYVRVLVDERGTGASFGTSGYGPAEVGDLREIVAWIVRQPWSNGRVGAIGISIEGTASELLAATGQPAVRAVAPWFSDYDYYTDIVRPGGVFDDWVVKNFGTFTAQMDAGASARRVESDAGGSLLKQAVAQHGSNLDLYASMRQAEFLDDPLDASGRSLRDISIPAVRGELARSRVPMLILASWFDAGTAQGALQRYHDFSNVQEIYIGPWSHGAGFDANPFSPGQAVQPSREQQWLQALAFFDHYLKGAPGPTAERRIHYFTMGENRWHATAVWPPAGLSALVFHLDPDGSLAKKRAGSSRRVTLAVTFTGEANRWRTQFGGQAVDYSHALPGMLALTSFTTAPLSRPLEITGQAVLRLRLACAAADPSVLAYLVAVDPQGRAFALTEGHLRLLDRKPDLSQPTLHSYRRGDAEPVPPGKEIEADFTLLPTSVLLPRGYRLRLLLAAGDSSTFATSGAYDATIFSASAIELPARARR